MIEDMRVRATGQCIYCGAPITLLATASVEFWTHNPKGTGTYQRWCEGTPLATPVQSTVQWA